jgi:energy-converting hydrogenase Eha subunit A
VFAKTNFSLLELLFPTIVIALFIGGIFLDSTGDLWVPVIIGATIGALAYVLYWYFIKPPVCPMCNAIDFR